MGPPLPGQDTGGSAFGKCPELEGHNSLGWSEEKLTRYNVGQTKNY